MFACLFLVIACVSLQVNGKITEEGIFVEELERNPAKYLPEVIDTQLGGDVVAVTLVVRSLGYGKCCNATDKRYKCL